MPKKKKKIVYEYLEKDKWVEYAKPKKSRQFGFFGTRTNGSYGEAHWGDGEIVKRGHSSKQLFAWVHDNVFMLAWGDMRIKRIK